MSRRYFRASSTKCARLETYGRQIGISGVQPVVGLHPWQNPRLIALDGAPMQMQLLRIVLHCLTFLQQILHDDGGG
jgi:hypothetical protein